MTIPIFEIIKRSLEKKDQVSQLVEESGMCY